MPEPGGTLRLRSSADGWRGVAGESFTPYAAGLLAGCVVEAARPSGDADVLVTHDSRAGGEAAALEVAGAVLAAGARSVRLVPHLPTPTVSAAVRHGHADLALLVTASHNPAHWNGLKVKTRPGAPLATAVESEADALFADRLRAAPRPVRTVVPVDGAGADELVRDHVERVLAVLPRRPDRRLRVVVDGLGGIAGEPVARLCEELNWVVRRTGCRPLPDFGGLVPDPSLPAARERVAREVVRSGADLGAVLDGDGDRLYLLDHRGRTLWPHETLALLLRHRFLHSYGGPDRGVAVTVATGTAVHRTARQLGVPVREAGVGFKHLAPLLIAGDADAAGGGVGDLAFTEFGVDRDPFAALALFADLLARSGATAAALLDGLRREVGPLCWFESRAPGHGGGAALRDTGLRALRAAGLADAVTDVTGVDGVKFWLPDGQWVLLRASSTEGGVRVCGELLERRAREAVVATVPSRVLADAGRDGS